MPAALVEFAPVSPVEWGFFWVSLGLAIAAFALITRVYRHGRLATYITALCISWIPVQVIALVAEDRQMWLPGQHSAVFFWGDSVALPLVAVAFAWMRQEWTRQAGGTEIAIADRWPWKAAMLAVALGVSFAFHLSQVLTWTPEALHAPSKVWHDYLVYPVFLYFLLTQVPFLWQVRWRRSRVQPVLAGLALLGGAAWFLLGHVYDPWQAHDQRPLLVIASGPVNSPAQLAGLAAQPLDQHVVLVTSPRSAYG